jgi:hypothetical protein
MTPEEQKEYNRNRAREHVAKGLCCSCSNKAVEGKVRCQKCLDRTAELAAARYQKRKALGVCPQCKKKPAMAGSVYCKDCLQYHKDKMDVRRRQDDYKVEQKARSAKWYEERKAAGICAGCDKPAVPGKVYCETCHKTGIIRDREARAEWARIVFAHYGTICKCCGQDKPVEHLQIDHVAGDGAAHRKEIGQSRLYPWLIKQGFPAGFITLCCDCNFAWGHNRCCPDAKSRLVPTTVDGVAVQRDPQTGKLAR